MIVLIVLWMFDDVCVPQCFIELPGARFPGSKGWPFTGAYGLDHGEHHVGSKDLGCVTWALN